MSNLTVDQTRNSHHPRGVELAMVAVSLGETLIAAKATDGVLNDNAAAREGGVISYILRRAGVAIRLLARRCPQTLRMQLSDALIGRVPHTTHPLRQTLHQARLLQKGDIGCRAWYTVCHIDYCPLLFIDRHLALKGVLPL